MCKSYIQLTRLISLYFCSFPVVICICILLCTLTVFIFKKKGTHFLPTLFVFAVRRKNDLFFFLFSNCSLFVWNLSYAISLKTFVWSFVRHFCCCFQSVQTTESWTCRILFTFWVEFFSSFFFKSVCVSNQIGNSAFFTSHRCCLNRYYFVYNNVTANNAFKLK